VKPNILLNDFVPVWGNFWELLLLQEPSKGLLPEREVKYVGK
jgi:hypothetical protein